MNRTIKANLSVKGLRKIAQALNECVDTRIPKKCNELVLRLANVGIGVARSTLSDGFRSYITFSKRVEIGKDSVTCYMVATEKGQILSEWEQYGTKMSINISPLLMSEFGSGKYAVAQKTLPNGKEVGRGTYSHGVQNQGLKNRWWWYDGENWHMASGVKRTEPLFHAFMEMYLQIAEAAEFVFGRY